MNDTFSQLDMANLDSLDVSDYSPVSPAVELPSPNTKRWVVRRKAVVVAAVRNGTLSLQEACGRYNLSVEEFLAWHRSIDHSGGPGLSATRVQLCRDTRALRA